MKTNKLLLPVAVLLFLCLVFTYSNHFHNPFHFDDDHTIVSNQYIRDIRNVPLFFKDATTTSSLPANQAYRPGVTTLNAIDHWIGGKSEPVPFYFHVSIFISYVLLGILLYFFLLKIFNTALQHRWNPYFALFGTGFYMLHTANAETINYIIARSDSFSTFMIVLAFVVYQYRPEWRRFQVHLLPVIIGLFVKEPTVMIVPLMVLYVYFFENDGSLPGVFSRDGLRRFGRSVLAGLGALIVAILFLALTMKVSSGTFTPGGSSTFLYIITQPFVIVHYINNFILPVNLSADTDWTLVSSIFDDRVLVGSGVILGLILIAWYTSRRMEGRPIAFGICWFLLALLPTSVVPLSEVLNDHRTFFPYIGLVIAGVWALARLVIKHEEQFVQSGVKRASLISAAALLICAHAWGTRQRNATWSSSETLWYDVTVKSPNNARGLMNYGNALMSKGKFKEAEEYYNRAKKIWPAYSYVYINLAILKNSMGQPAEAENNFKYALSLNPENPEAYFYYAQFLVGQSRAAEAKKILDDGLKVSPAHQNMLRIKKDLESGTVVTLSKLDQAIINADQNPTADNYIELSLQYYLAARYDMCIKAAEEALKINPNSDIAYNNICSAYNMLRQWDKAIAAGEKGLKINPNNQLLQNNLKASLQGKAGGS